MNLAFGVGPYAAVESHGFPGSLIPSVVVHAEVAESHTQGIPTLTIDRGLPNKVSGAEIETSHLSTGL
jgi:hypothetical protein